MNTTAQMVIVGEDYVPDFVDADFTMICEDDSMINARIFPGDTVYLKCIPIESGDIAAVYIGNKLTLRRFFSYPDYIALEAENPKYRRITIYQGQEVPTLIKAIAFTARLTNPSGLFITERAANENDT